MALYDSSPSSNLSRDSRAFNFLASGMPTFGQEAKAFRRRSEQDDAETAVPSAIQGAANTFSGEGTARLFSDPVEQQRNYTKFASSTLENIGAMEAERKRAEAERAGAQQRSAASQQASTMGLIGTGIGAAGSIVAGVLI